MPVPRRPHVVPIGLALLLWAGALRAESPPGQADPLWDLRDAYRRADEPLRAPAAGALLKALLEAGDRAATNHDVQAARRLYDEARAVARAEDVPVQDCLDHRDRRLAPLAQAVADRTRWRGKLARDPDDRLAARMLVQTYAIGLDDPNQALNHLETSSASQAFRTYLPLAARDADDLPPASAWQLARWYLDLARRTEGFPAERLLQRARGLLRRVEAADDKAIAEPAETALAEIEARLSDARRRMLVETDRARTLREGLDEPDRAALSQACAYLLSRIDPNVGATANEARPRKAPLPSARLAYALVCAGEHPAFHRRLARLARALAADTTQRTVELAWRVQLWTRLGKPYRDALRRDVSTLLDGMETRSAGFQTSTTRLRDGELHLHSSYHAWYALSAASAEGLRLGASRWRSVASHLATEQRDDGGWNARLSDEGKRPSTLAASSEATAILVLAAASLRAEDRARLKPTLRGALACIERLATAALVEAEEPDVGEVLSPLVAIQRMALASRLKQIGELDWRDVGTRLVRRAQANSGAIGGAGATELAVIFLAGG